MRNIKETKGKRTRFLHYFTILIACILYAVLIYETLHMSETYQALVDTTQDYLTSKEAAEELCDASDYLTEQARLYSINMEPKYMFAYFDEINVNERQKKAIDELEKYHSSDQDSETLQKIRECSEELMNLEIYSMKLISTANYFEMSSFPKALQETELNTGDMQLSRKNMISLAQQMIFNNSYQELKEELQQYVDLIVNPVLTETEQLQWNSIEEANAAITRGRIVLNILLILNLLSFVSITILAIRPLHAFSSKCSKCSSNETALNIPDYEFQPAVKTYKEIYTHSIEREVILRNPDEHDTLTGLLNRRAFSEVSELLEGSTTPFALLLIDVDEFTLLNDNYGKDIGDKILKKVAHTLSINFRSCDSIARIGNDKFAIIMSNTTRQLQSVIKKKSEYLNERLMHPDDDLPAVSLSIGVTFSISGYNKSLLHQSNRALYHIKELGQCGCAFYEE